MPVKYSVVKDLDCVSNRLSSQAQRVVDLVGLGGIEPPTSPLSGVRSSHLSYRPRPAAFRAAAPGFTPAGLPTGRLPGWTASAQLIYGQARPTRLWTISFVQRVCSLVELVGIEPATS